MRPINNAPTPQENGIDKAYNDYKEWREDLISAYGQHCVYCNDRLQSKFEVEHQIAQSLGIVPPLVWNNLFLACGPCNMAKSAKNATATTHYFPNKNNTHLIFNYITRPHLKNGKIACIPVVSPVLNPVQNLKASETIKHTELDRVEQNPLRERKMTDVRWLNRFNAFELAKSQRHLWDTLTTSAQISAYLNTISPMINKSGFFSIWVEAFSNVPEVLRVIVACLPNTSVSSFDINYQPIPRNPNDPDDTI